MHWLFLAMYSCSSDDDSNSDIEVQEEQEENQTAESIIRIAQVNAVEDTIVLTNFGNETAEVGGFFLCLGPGTYANVGNIATGSTSLAPDASITLSYDVSETVDGFSLFSTNTFGSSDPEILLDYVQWGEGNQARVGQAVTAGRWNNANAFVPATTSFSFTGDATDVGDTFWE